jgi:DNA-binding NtrC family response regulator
MGEPCGQRILIVDDEQDVLQVCSRVLTRSGYVVQVAESAEEARRYLDQERFDLVILDIHMPDEDGISLLKYVRAENSTLPAILITGYPEMETVMASVRLSVSEYLCKPFTMQKLLEAVATGLKSAGEENQQP